MPTIFIQNSELKNKSRVLCVDNQYYSTIASSTESVLVATTVNNVPVQPPTTISWLFGRTAAKHLYRGVAMWLMTSQEIVVKLYW